MSLMLIEINGCKISVTGWISNSFKLMRLQVFPTFGPQSSDQIFLLAKSWSLIALAQP